MKNKLLILFVLVCYVFVLHGQTVNKWWLDGALYFKLKDNVSIQIPSDGQKVNLNDVDFLQPFIDVYGIYEINKPFYTADDNKLQRTYKIKFNDIYGINNLIKDLSQLSIIEYAEPAPIYYTSYIPNDTYHVSNLSGSLGSVNPKWHLDVINAEAAWDISKGDSSIIVAVLDNAIWTDHPDLQNKIAIEVDLGDGDNDANPPDATYIWSHGTHCAGLIGAESDNGVGVASIGYGVSIMAVKLASDASDGQAMTAGFEGIVWAADHGADVISMSWGSPQYFVTMQNTVNYAYNKGCVLLGAAGNNGNGLESQMDPSIPVNYVGYPAALEHVIAVASTDVGDNKSDFSEYGTWIDVCAPGGYYNSGFMGIGAFSVLSTTYSDAGDVWSTLTGSGGGAASYGVSGKYDVMQGTSMACPVAAGLAGLMLSVNPNLTPEELTAIMKATCDDIDAQNPNFIDSIGAGRINAAAALAAVQDSMALSPLVADFQASSVVIPEGGSVDFTDLSIGNPTTWNWIFEGGNPSTSTMQNPTGIVYDTAGVYSVTLEISDGTYSDTEIKTYFIIVGQSSNANSAWLPQSTGFSQQFVGILDICIVDPNTAWAVTYDGTSGAITDYFTRTTDGGNTWIPGVINDTLNMDVAMISAINDTVAWVAKYDVNGGGAILKTTDGGQTWVHQSTAAFDNASSFANIVHFFNENEGYCMGDPVNNEFEVYITSDGGNTWTLVDGANLPDPQSGEMGWTGVCDAVNDTAWFGTNTGRIYKTTDKGATWNVYSTGEANVSKISMHDGMNGIMLAAVYDQQTGSLTSWAMRKTNDGGETWTPVTPVGNYFKSDMAAVPGVPGKIISTGISQDPAECGSAYSLDYGASWTQLDDSIQYTCVEFYNDTTGWAGGFNLDSLTEGIWKWIGIPVTDNPVITSTPATSVVVHDLYTYNITASDPNQLPLTITATTLPSWLTFNQLTDSTAVITGTPDSLDVGMHNVEIMASNGTQSVTQPFTIEVLTDVPYFTSNPNTAAIFAYDTYTYNITAADNNGDTLVFGSVNLPVWLTLTDNGDNTALLTGTPDTSNLGWSSITITITDGVYVVDQSWNLLVKPLGINNPELIGMIKVFPNPANDFINVTAEGVNINSVSLYSVLGSKIIIETSNKNNHYLINTQSLSAGTYLIEIQTNKGVVRNRIIIQ
ncbi:MAG: hypothetical protein Kow0068_04520 [Marinilabiliales bacterium]